MAFDQGAQVTTQLRQSSTASRASLNLCLTPTSKVVSTTSTMKHCSRSSTPSPHSPASYVGGGSAGVLEGQDFTPTEQGTPQGGVISPLLANLALHGMEKVAKEGFGKSHSVEKPILVRYADDFVILYSDQAVLQRVAERVTAWLADM